MQLFVSLYMLTAQSNHDILLKLHIWCFTNMSGRFMCLPYSRIKKDFWKSLFFFKLSTGINKKTVRSWAWRSYSYLLFITKIWENKWQAFPDIVLQCALSLGLCLRLQLYWLQSFCPYEFLKMGECLSHEGQCRRFLSKGCGINGLACNRRAC